MKNIILASKSPRRKQLLQMLEIPFEIIVADIDEIIDSNNDLRSEIEKISYKKAYEVFENHKDNLVIGADTIVKINNDVLGKPRNHDQAKAMLLQLSNNTHEVITACTILVDDKVETFSEIAKVTFYPMSEEEIDDYIQTKEPMDKAGAYAIQGLGSKFVKSIEGDFYTIMGLPVAQLYHRLLKYM